MVSSLVPGLLSLFLDDLNSDTFNIRSGETRVIMRTCVVNINVNLFLRLKRRAFFPDIALRRPVVSGGYEWRPLPRTCLGAALSHGDF